ETQPVVPLIFALYQVVLPTFFLCVTLNVDPFLAVFKILYFVPAFARTFVLYFNLYLPEAFVTLDTDDFVVAFFVVVFFLAVAFFAGCFVTSVFSTQHDLPFTFTLYHVLLLTFFLFFAFAVLPFFA